MGFFHYCLRVLRAVFTHSLSKSQDILFGALLLSGAVVWVSRYFRMKYDFTPWLSAFSGWEIAACVFGSIILVRLLLAPYWLWKEGQDEIAVLNTQIANVGRGTESLPGRWHGKRFVLNDPMVILTALVTSANNDAMQVFELPFAPAHSLVEIIVDIDRRDERVKAGVVWARTPDNPSWRGNNRLTRTSLRLPDDRLFALQTLADLEASPTTIRVKIASWELRNSA